MKITQFDDLYTSALGFGGTTLVTGTSGGSNSFLGGDATGSPGSVTVVSLRQLVSLASNMGDNTVGTVLTTISSSPWVAEFAVPSNGVGTSSPLTTKGDLYTFTAANARLAVGSNGTGLMADPAEPSGLRWTTRALVGELLMADGVTGPPIPIESDPVGDDWLYADL